MSLFSGEVVVSKAEKWDITMHHFHSSRKRMIAWSVDHQIQLYALPKLKLCKSFSYNSSITAVAVSAIQSVLILGLMCGTLHFIDLRALNLLKTHKSIHKGNQMKYPCAYPSLFSGQCYSHSNLTERSVSCYRINRWIMCYHRSP